MDKIEEIIIGKFRAVKTIYERDLSITEEGMKTLCDTLRQSLYKLLVDEMPKEKGIPSDDLELGRNQMRTEALAVIKRVLIGGDNGC